MGKIRVLLLAAAVVGYLSIPMSVCAHETIPEYWCVDQESSPKIIKSFDFDGKQLKELYARCGIVDSHDGDEWHAANAASQYYCDTLLPGELSDRTLVIPFIAGPKSFNDKTHHSIYRMDQGLIGSCVVCVTLEK